jgi:hypothetical protein
MFMRLRLIKHKTIMTKYELAEKLKVPSYHVEDYAWDVSSDAILKLVNEIEQSHKHNVVRSLPLDELKFEVEWNKRRKMNFAWEWIEDYGCVNKEACLKLVKSLLRQ